MVWCTQGGGRPHVLTPLEHSYCTLEGQLEVIMSKKEEQQTTSVYQNSHSTLTTLLGCRVDERSCMGLNIRLEVMIMVHFAQSMSTMSRVQCATLQHEKPSSWTREYYGYLMANYHGHHRTMFECVDQSPESVPGSSANTGGALFYHTEVKCNGIPCPPYDAQKEVTCVVCTK